MNCILKYLPGLFIVSGGILYSGWACAQTASTTLPSPEWGRSDIISLSQTLIYGVQAVFLFVTIIVMARSTRSTISVMSAQIEQLRCEVSLSANAEVMDKLISFYSTCMDHPDTAVSLFSGTSEATVEDAKKMLLAFTLLDFLYLLFLQKNAVDKEFYGAAWAIWSRKVCENDFLRDTLSAVKAEYPGAFVASIQEAGGASLHGD